MAELAYIQVARVCNQKCLFCSNPANGRTITWEEGVSLVDQFAAAGAPGVILTGGEPTLFADLPRLVAYAVEKKLPPRLITNGQRTSDFEYLKSLFDAGLDHLHVSVHSHRDELQGRLTGNPESLRRIRRTLENAGRLGLRVDVNTVINKENAADLARIVRWLTADYPFLAHFVWNNLDPRMNQASLNPELVPRLADLEAPLHEAMTFLDEGRRGFRVERVPLCFMSEFPHRSTETRKLVKDEGRRIYFLDAKGLRVQDRESWTYGKSPRCAACPASPVCAGLYQMDGYYSSAELCPLFVSPEEIARRVREDWSI